MCVNLVGHPLSTTSLDLLSLMIFTLFLVLKWNCDAVCGNRFLIPTIFIISHLLSDSSICNLLKSPNQEHSKSNVKIFLIRYDLASFQLWFPLISRSISPTIPSDGWIQIYSLCRCAWNCRCCLSNDQSTTYTFTPQRSAPKDSQ